MKKLLTTLLCVALAAASVIGLTACKDKTPTGDQTKTLDLTASEDWIDANENDISAENSHAGERVYKFATGSDKSKQMSPMTVEKFDNGDWSALYHGLGANDMTQYKKLVVKAKAGNATYTPNPTDQVPTPEAVTEPATMMIKFESKPAIGGGNEFTVELSETEKTFEFKLDYPDYEYALAGAKQLTFIVGPGKPNYKADITISAVYFTNEATVDANVINKTAGVVQIPIVYDGVADKLDINRGWAPGNDGNITTAFDKEAKTTTVTIPGEKAAWEYTKTVVTGNLTALTKVRIKFKAAAGTTFKFKLEPIGLAGFETKTENEIAATGEVQTWEFNFSDMQGWTSIEKNLPADAEAETPILIFPSPNMSAIATPYTIVIYEIELLK